jgi:diadenosine tetraphosphate (Ap4A) HIT family hydrolase
VGTTLRWAKGAPPAKKKKGNREEVLEALGMKRQYFPADSRTDCWFCLASPACETHLITGVYDEWYAAMPKGPVHPGHILLVPVTHTRDGAWNLNQEWIQLVEKLQQHAAQAYNMDLFVFERAMETKGGYHTHIQCVPVPRDSITTLQSTMLAHAQASGFDLRPIQSDLGVKVMINKDEPYFYAEIRTKSQNHRFLYRRDANNGEAANVPLQFAREVLASVLKNPKLAHWKACVVDKEQEAEITSQFRTSFNAMV